MSFLVKSCSLFCAFLIFSDVVSATYRILESPETDDDFVQQKPIVVKITPPSISVTQPTKSPLRTRVVVVHNNMVPVPIECFQPPDSGSCAKDMVRIYYDHETRTCKPFSYTGCGGNANRFLSVKNCYRICHPYRYQIKPVVAHIKQRAPIRIQPVRRRRVVVKPPVEPEEEEEEHQIHHHRKARRPQVSLVPVSSYQSVPYVQSMPVVRSGFVAVPSQYQNTQQNFMQQFRRK